MLVSSISGPAGLRLVQLTFSSQKPAFGEGHLAAVMRWRAPIERPAKGEAVIGWHGGAAGGGGADRGAQSLDGSTSSPLGSQRGDAVRLKADVLSLANTTRPRHFSPPVTVWLRLPQQAQMATQMVIGGPLNEPGLNVI